MSALPPRVFYSRGSWWVAEDGCETDGPFDTQAAARAWANNIEKDRIQADDEAHTYAIWNREP